MKETGRTIGKWAQDTFGPAGTDLEVLNRAMAEIDELRAAILNPDTNGLEIAMECADVSIILARLADREGFDLFHLIDEKMAVNRKREWTLDGKGHGQHVPTPPSPGPGDGEEA